MRQYFICSIFAILSFATLNADTTLSVESLYSKMKESQSRLYPKGFEAELEGEIVNKQISTIPSNKYANGLSGVKLIFKFTQNQKPLFILQNVDSFYRNMFSIFEGVLETTGFYAVVGVNKTYKDFMKIFDIKQAMYKADYVEAVAFGRGDDGNYSVVYKISKETFFVEEASYFLKSKKIYQVNIEYTQVGGYIVPKSIFYKSMDGEINSDISFMNVQIFTK